MCRIVGNCHKSEPLVLDLFFHINNVFWKCIPWLISMGFAVNVLCYAFKDKMKNERERLSKSQPHNQIPSISRQISGSIQEHEYENNVQNLESEEEKISNNRESNQEDENKFKVIRKNSSYDMFYKVVVEEEEEEKVVHDCMNFLVLEVLANVIKEYIQTITIQMCFLPMAVFDFYFYFTDSQPYDSVIKLRGFSIMVFMISYFLLALRK